MEYFYFVYIPYDKTMLLFVTAMHCKCSVLLRRREKKTAEIFLNQKYSNVIIWGRTILYTNIFRKLNLTLIYI